MAFCTQCGHRNPDDGRFCEECGQPLAGQFTVAAPVAPTTRTGDGKPAKRLLVVAGATLAAVVLVGVGLAYILMPESASTDNFEKAIKKGIEKNPDLLRSRYCLTNFAYDEDPVYVNPYDRNTQRWLQLLVDAGLYTAPETITTGSGFFNQTRLKYNKTPEAASVIRDKQLCFAEGVALKSVDSFTPPRKVGEQEVSEANVTLTLKNPVAWSQTETARRLNERFAPVSAASFTLVLTEGKWELVGDLPPTNASRKIERTPPAKAKAEEKGFFAKLFSFGQSNPILGTWATGAMGMELARFEFRPDSMRARGVDIKVRYKIEDAQVIVYAEGDTNGMVLRIIDKDNLIMGEGLAQVQLVRVN